MRTSARSACAAACVVAVYGCLPRPVTVVTVRDPRAVSLEMDTPGGRETVLPAQGRSEEVLLPRSVPPWNDRLQLTASAIRDGAGGISVRCDACQLVPTSVLMPPSGTTVWAARAHEVVDWRADDLRMRFDHPFEPLRRGRVVPDRAFTVYLATPTTNVVEVHEKRIARPSDGWWLVGIAGFVALSGAVLVASAEVPGFSSHPDKSLDAFGIGFLALGLALGVDGAVIVATPGSDVTLGPRR